MSSGFLVTMQSRGELVAPHDPSRPLMTFSPAGTSWWPLSAPSCTWRLWKARHKCCYKRNASLYAQWPVTPNSRPWPWGMETVFWKCGTTTVKRLFAAERLRIQIFGALPLIPRVRQHSQPDCFIRRVLFCSSRGIHLFPLLSQDKT